MLAVSCASGARRAAVAEAEGLAAYQFHLARYVERCAPKPTPPGFSAAWDCDEQRSDLLRLLGAVRELEEASKAGAPAVRQRERLEALVKEMDTKWPR